ncbi:MAG: zinc ABC transporter substrate-binding protein [Candidatus Gracilibacteria bacterium]|nr:zinc ABC transporter substrate-binding protein [Candidatus Gracilibacteria bacterium]
MKKTLIFITLLFTIILSSCNNEKQENTQILPDKIAQTTTKVEKPVIYTSFYPIYFLTKSLVGDEVDVINLVPAGGEPHDFEPTLKQVAEMGKSKMIILNGLGIESYEEKLLESIKNVPIVMISEQLKNLINLDNNKKVKTADLHDDEHGHDHGNIDPHTWLSPKQYRDMADILVVELEKNGFTNLDKSILQKISDLDAKYNKDLEKCKMIQLVSSHAAFGYFARDYGFRQKAIFGISPNQEPSAKDISAVITLIKNQKLKYIFSEQFVSPKFSEAIKLETGVSVLNLHPLETLSQDEESKKLDYISIMESNLWDLKTGLECSN